MSAHLVSASLRPAFPFSINLAVRVFLPKPRARGPETFDRPRIPWIGPETRRSSPGIVRISETSRFLGSKRVPGAVIVKFPRFLPPARSSSFFQLDGSALYPVRGNSSVAGTRASERSRSLSPSHGERTSTRQGSMRSRQVRQRRRVRANGRPVVGPVLQESSALATTSVRQTTAQETTRSRGCCPFRELYTCANVARANT